MANMPSDTNYLLTLAFQAHRTIKNNKLKLIFYATLALIGALLLSVTFGQHYDGSNHKLRGEPKRREAPQAPPTQTPSTGGGSGDETIKDPFASRPRIRTKNGHLVIEASRDKNIDFKTSGSRGTVTINGHKLDQLLNVTKALEKSAQFMTDGGGGGDSGSGPLSAGSAQRNGGGDQYELLVRNLFGSGERIAMLERGLADLKGKFSDLDSRIVSMGKKISKRMNLLAAIGKQQETILAKLKRNDCFNAETGQPACKNGATCVDGYDEFKCLCTAQFEGATCSQDVDECQKFKGTELGCQNGATCINLMGGYRCECPAQFHGVHCTELYDDCTLSSQSSLCANGKCVNLARSTPNQPKYECICDQGWTTDGQSPACIIDINECLAGQVPPAPSPSTGNASITNSYGNEWRSIGLSARPNSPVAAYPCSQNPYVECTNLPGSFQCGPCPAGYTGNGRICLDLDECLVNNGGCSIQPLVECINVQGNRRCGPCPPGYTGDGVTCLRISACQAQPNGGCHTMAKCIDLPGLSLSSRLCVCKYPYSGDGSGPDGCKPLPVSLGPAIGGGGGGGLNNTKTDDVDGQNSNKLLKQDDCNPNPCSNGATCLPTETSFECICPMGWMGPTCLDVAPVCGGAYFVSQGRLQFTLSGSSTNELLKSEAEVDPETGEVLPLVHKNDKTTTTTTSARQGERYYKCKWFISVATNMSIKLDLSGFMNKLKPSQKVLMFLANGTTSTHTLSRHQKIPPCKEYLDVWDRLDLGSVQLDQERRLLARFCADSPVLAHPDQSLDPTKQVTILTESHGAQLDYTFMSTRSAFGDPSLAFRASWQAINPPCGGDITLSSTNPSGSITSPKFPDFYEPGTECRYVLRATPGKRLRIQIGELSLLTSGFRSTTSSSPGSDSSPSNVECADSLTIIDGAIGPDRPILFRHCANNATLANPRFPGSALVSSSQVAEIILASNFNSTTPLLRPKQRKGFLLTYSEEPAAPGCGGTYTHRSGTIRSGDYEPARVVSVEDDAYFAQQLSAYMAERMAARDGGGDQQEPHQHARRLMHEVWHSMVKMITYRPPGGRYLWWYKSRCEYVIKPTDKARNHKVSIDWLELPREPDADGSSESFNSKLSRRWTCSRSRLTIYDGVAMDDSNRTEIVSFCSGDKYNSSSPIFAPIISTGRILYLVYETTLAEDHYNGNSNNNGAGKETYLSPGGGGGGGTSNQANGFKLHYSTVCSAVYSHLADRIQVEISPEMPECVYHIVLPPHNTISLVVEPQMSDSTSLMKGSCPYQAIFLDGALQQGVKSTLVGLERELRRYNFGSDGQQNDATTTGNGKPVEDINFTTARVDGGGDSDSDVRGLHPDRWNYGDGGGDGGKDKNANGNNNKDSYWQYSSSLVHDIKEFEVCKLPELKFDSIWNHLSILFRFAPEASQPILGTATSGEPLQLTVQYRSEPSCGGILSDPVGGKIRLDLTSLSLPASQNKTITSDSVASRPQGSPPSTSMKLNGNKSEKACAWVFRAAPNQVVQFEFEAPVAEIKQRFNDWLSWSYSSYRDSLNSSNSKLSTAGPEFNCSQVFQEIIEIYEPPLNRTRQLCPMDLLSGSNSNSSTNSWVTGSSIALMRLRNTTEPQSNSTAIRRWPGLRPLAGSQPIQVAYQFKAAKGRKCGGRLLHASGVITSPRHPFHYPPMTNCIWIIQTPNAHQQIRLNVTSFNLEGSPNCLFDYLELRNGPSEESPLIGRFCDHDLQSKVLISHSNLLWLHFRSDGHLSRPGFEIRYDGAQTGCGGRLTTASGQIDSPNYPYPFGHSADCEWTIELSQSNRIELTIQDLDLSSSTTTGNQLATTSACGSDPLTRGQGNYLAIYDSSGASDAAVEPLVKVCHKSQLNKTTLVSASNKFFIVFKSKALDNSRGFRLTYRTLCANIELVGFRGVIESPGYPANYPARTFCNWTIRAPLGSNLTLALTELDMEDGTVGSSSSGDPSTGFNGTSSLESVVAMSVPIVDYTTRTIKKAGWPCPVDALVVWAVYSNSSSKIQQSKLPGGNSKPPLISNATLQQQQQPPLGEPNSRMVNYYCGQLTKLGDKDRYLELDTNVAYLSFESDRSIEGRGFRLEWRSEGCGNAQVSDSVEPIAYREPDTRLGRPTECLWSFQLAKAAGTMEFVVTSDLRGMAAGQSLNKDPCNSGSLTIFDGLTDKAPILHRNCDSQRQRVSVATSGGQALIRFYTDGNGAYGRSFVLTGQLVHRDDCMSSEVDIQTPFNQRAGLKQSPQYPNLYDGISYHCFGSFSTNNGRMRFTIEELDIPVDMEATTSEATSGQQLLQQQPMSGLLSPEQCKKSGNYLRIRGLMQNDLEEIFCGKMDASNPRDLARSTIVTEQEASLVEFRTSRSELRGRWRFSYDRLCGSFVPIYFGRDFSTPNYPDRPKWPGQQQQVDSGSQQQHEDRACIWRLSTSLRPSASPQSSVADKNKLHFGLINFQESSDPNDCLRVYEGVDLSLRSGHFNLTDLDGGRLAPKLKICKQSDLTHRALFYVSLGAELTILVTGNAIAKFRVKPFEDFCGAELQLDQGEFASLGYPEPYGPNLDCTYYIMGAPGSRVDLKFIDFDLPEGDNTLADSSNATTSKCDNVDYVEIRQMPVKKLIEQRLKPKGPDSYFADYLSDDSNSQDPNYADQAEEAQEQDSAAPPSSSNTTSQSTINKPSPLDRLNYLAKLYSLFNDQRRSSSSMILFHSGVSLGDFHENSNLLGRFCGKQAPQQQQLLGLNMRDQILVRLRSHGPSSSPPSSGGKRLPAPKGFLAEYKLTYGGLFKLTDKASMDGGVISSPRYPAKSSINGSITWKFETRIGYILQFELVSLDLGPVHQACQDTLSIYDGLDPMTAYRLSRMCGRLFFRNNNLGGLAASTSSGRQFLRQIQEASGYQSSHPIANYTAIFRAHEPEVKTNLVRLIRSSFNVATVLYDNRNTGDASFLLRYRAIKSTPKSNNSIDDLPEILQQQQQQSIGGPEMDTGGRNASKSCSGSYLLALNQQQQQNSSQVLLTSPNWPKPPPVNGIECHWLVYTHENTNIRLTFDAASSYQVTSSGDNSNDMMTDDDSLRRPDYCLEPKSERRPFVVVHDGASRLAPVIGRYCLPIAPITVKSSGRHMFVRYVNPIMSERGVKLSPSNSKLSLFKALASVSECGGQFHITMSALISHKPQADLKRKRKMEYANNLNCKYHLFAGSLDEVLVINEPLSRFDLAKEPTNANCTVGDYLEIRDLPIQSDLMDYSRSLSGRLLGRFCAGHPLQDLESPGSAISLEFKTDSENTATGWSLFVTSSMPHINCPKGYMRLQMDDLYGRITSPNWPHGFTGKRQCRYLLVAPNNQSLQVRFVRLRRPHGDEEQPDKCTDSFTYLPDNEAWSLRYRSEPLAEIQSQLSGARLSELVKTMPCNSSTSTLPSASSDRLDELLQSSSTSVSASLDGSTTSEPNQSFKKISAEEYYKLLELPQSSFSIGPTRSHVLMLNYEAKNLLPNEGFVAVIRILPASPVSGCGGSELSLRPLGGVKSKSAGIQDPSLINSNNNNLFQSGAFGLETKLEDDYIQCEWSLKSLDIDDYSIGFESPYADVFAQKLTSSTELGNFTTPFIVFDTLEIPSLTAGQSLIDQDWNGNSNSLGKPSSICGFNRLIITDSYNIDSVIACGNLTNSVKWLHLAPYMSSIHLRTKNLRLPSSGSSTATQSNAFHRGVKGRLYAKSCVQEERLVGESIRFRSHYGYPNSSYQPGLCQWEVRLSGGDYHLWFDNVKLRLPANTKPSSPQNQNSCDPQDSNNNNDLDYLEIRASSGGDAPLISRICAHNQMEYTQKKPLLLSMRSELKLVFVAGINRLTMGLETFDYGQNEATSGDNGNKQQQQVSGQQQTNGGFGFDLELVRIRNISDFCRRDSRGMSIHWFIRNKKSNQYAWSPSMASFLYPNNTHCEIPMLLDEGQRFNFTFRGMFDFESSPDCSNDYIQIDDIFEQQQPLPGGSKVDEDTGKKKKTTTTTTKQPVAKGASIPLANIPPSRSSRGVSRIGRWCGRARPAGYFVSKSERVRVTFHSNDRVEGKGFQLEYSIISPSSTGNSTGTGNRRLFPKPNQDLYD